MATGLFGARLCPRDSANILVDDDAFWPQPCYSFVFLKTRSGTARMICMIGAQNHGT
jgi:hypothetical protein